MLIYHDLIKGFDQSKIAYCYSGNEKGKVSLYLDGELHFLQPRNYEKPEYNSSFDFWVFLDEADEDVRIEAINSMFVIYCEHYNYLFENKSFNI